MNKKNISSSFVRFFLSSFLFLSLASCSFTSSYFNPKFVEDDSASWDGEFQNSGIISYEKGKGFLITETAAKRYSDLTDKFGATYIPKISHGEGLYRIDNDYYLPNRYMVVFAVFNQKNKRGDIK